MIVAQVLLRLLLAAVAEDTSHKRTEGHPGNDEGAEDEGPHELV